MSPKILTAPQASAPIEADVLLKMTSLQYLRDALKAERYEECASLIASAKSYGASEGEVSEVIAQFVEKLQIRQRQAGIQRRRFS